MDQATNPPHVLIFPFPAQGHVNSMLKLAELLGLSGIHITFLVTPNIYGGLMRHTTVISRFSKYPGFYLESLPAEIDQDHSDSHLLVANMSDSLKSVAKPYLRQLLAPNGAQKGSSSKPPITSIIADGILSVALDVAQENGVPFIYFRTIGASAFWAYFCIPELIEAGELPFTGEDLDMKIANVKGMEDFLRRRDLPSICRGKGLTSDPSFKMVLRETLQTPRAQGLILNTFEHLEVPILSLIRTRCPNLYTIGPLHAHLKTRLQAVKSTTTSSSNSLWEEDRSCIYWLDKQRPKSVIYVCFGSFAKVTKGELLEFWHGLVNSGTRFLWVIRPDLVIGKDEGSKTTEDLELEEATSLRGYIVGWAPQEEVLAHQAVGGFLTHSGWNSTLESIVEGVPMICWPYFFDQQINSRFVGEVWQLGLDMKDTCNRDIVEKMVRDLMVVRKDEFLIRAEEMAKFAKNATSDGGSSFLHLERLVEDIRRMSIPPKSSV